MVQVYSAPIASPLYPRPPYHYDGARLFLALFYAKEEAFKRILPSPLRSSDLRLMGLMFGEHPCRETGRFMESAVLVQCMYPNGQTEQESVGVFFSHNYCDSDVALAAGREIWGYSRKLADITMSLAGDTLTAQTVRDGVCLMRAQCTLTDEGEWIDSGPNLNIKLIPSVDGSGHDIAALTAAHLKYDILRGRSGEVNIQIQSGPRDDLDMIEIESPMIGLYFDLNIMLPLGQIVKVLDVSRM